MLMLLIRVKSSVPNFNVIIALSCYSPLWGEKPQSLFGASCCPVYKFKWLNENTISTNVTSGKQTKNQFFALGRLQSLSFTMLTMVIEEVHIIVDFVTSGIQWIVSLL